MGWRADLSISKSSPPADWDKTNAIREWAREHGYELVNRGRIPNDVTTAYGDAQAEAAQAQVTWCDIRG
jgi:hypothetical protein